jgi:fibronectin-binding autotransporter adhesin
MWPGRLDINPTTFLRFQKWGVLGATLVFLLVSGKSSAYIQDTSFWRQRSPSLRFTTASQNLYAGNCSGLTTVATYSAGGVLTNTSSNLTVNLTGPGTTTFYSDSTCTVPISQIVITSGTSSNSFYFVETTAAAITLTAAATGYLSGTQTENMGANPFIWTGGGGNTNWTTGTNWSGGSAPGSSNQALFDNTCAANCSPDISSNISVLAIRLTNGYTGTINQTGAFTITVGSKGLAQLGGAFTGGNGSITVNGSSSVVGGTFTSTTGNWSVTENFMIDTAGATFNHNSGNVNLTFTSGIGNKQIQTTNAVFQNLSLIGDGYNNQKTIVGTTIVNGNFTCSTSYQGTMNSGVVSVKGNVVFSGTGCGGTSEIQVTGNSNQTITGASGAPMPSLLINSTGGTVTLAGTVRITRNFNYIAGNFDAGTSTVWFDSNGVSHTLNVGTSLDFNHVTFNGSGYMATWNITGTLVVNGAFACDTSSSLGTINSGVISAKGNLTFSTFGCTGSTSIQVTGSGNQTVSGASGAYIPSFVINSSGGTVGFTGTLRFVRDFIYTAGTFDAGTSTVWFDGNGVSHTLNLGTSLDFYNVTFNGSGYMTVWNLAGTLVVNNSFTCDMSSSLGSINSGVISAKGNVTFSTLGCSGTTSIQVTGSTNQTVSGVSGAYIPSLVINSTGGIVTLGGTLRLHKNFTYTAGTVDAGTSTVWIDFNSTSQSLNFGASPLDLYHVSFVGNGYSAIRTLTGTMNVNGTFVCDSTSSTGTVNSGAIVAKGNATFSTNGCAGTTTLTLAGTSSTTFTKNSTATLFSPGIVIDKTGGASALLAADLPLSSGQNATITNGTFDLGGYSLSVTSTLNVGAGTILRCNGGIYSAGTFVNNGTVNCPGFAAYEFNWTGAAADSNWSTPGNWQGGVAPGANDVPYFSDTYCGATCNANFGGAVTIRGMYMATPYTGTIVQGTTNTLTVGLRGWTQTAGTFSGGDAAITMNFASHLGTFSVTGGSFLSTSNTLQVGHTSGGSGQVAARTTFQVGSAATFAHNNGTVRINCSESWSGNQTCYIDVPGGITFKNLITQATGGYGNGVGLNGAQSASVLGDLTVLAGMLNGTGNIDVYGNMSFATSLAGTNYGNAHPVTLRGSANQTYAHTGNRSTVALTVNKTGGSVTAASTDARFAKLLITAGTFTAPTGTLTIGWSTNTGNTGSQTIFSLPAPANFVDSGGIVDFAAYDGQNGSAQYTINPNGNMTLTNAKITTQPGYSSNQLVIGGSKIIVTGAFTKVSGKFSGSWELQGSAAFGSGGDRGTASLTYSGTSNQVISGTDHPTGTVTVNKPAGSVIMSNALNLNGAGQALAITAGTWDMAGYALTVAGNINNGGVLKRGNSPACGALTQGSFTGTPAICP